MTDQQTLPPIAGGDVPHVGTYRRIVPVSLERMYENALDWEHLPFVHATSFGSIECIDSGPWGWRAALTSPTGQASEIELLLDRKLRRWITRNLTGRAAGAQIWTHVFELEPRELQLNVDFFVPGVSEDQRTKVGTAYADLYATLYDEDVEMMVERQRQLDRRIESARDPDRLLLGPVSNLPERSVHELGGQDWLLVRQEQALFVVPALCPHLLGPLRDGKIIDGCIECPWHGYRFDLQTGECRSGAHLVLAAGPQLLIEGGELTLVL